MQEANKCPNCGGQLNISKTRNKWICPYCESEFLMQGQTGDPSREEAENRTGAVLNPEMFLCEVDLERMMRYDDEVKRTIGTLQRCLNEMESVAEIEEYVSRQLINAEDIATSTKNKERIEAVLGKIADQIEAGEHILAYGDKGIFSKGKEFYVVTEKRTVFVDKKKVKTLLHRDLEFFELSSTMGTEFWWLNGDYEMTLNIGNHMEFLGAVLAMISILAFDGEKDRRRIVIKK